MSNSRNPGSRRSSRWPTWFSKRSRLRKELRRPTVESLEDRRLMAAVPYSDGLYYPPIGKYTGTYALQSQGVNQQEYVRRSNLTYGGGGSGSSSSDADGLASTISINTIEIEPNNVLRNAQVLPLGTVPGTSQTVNVSGTMLTSATLFDEDYFAVDLRAGDILDARISTGATIFDLSLEDASGGLLFATNLPTVGYYPPSSPLSTDGVASFAYVIPTSGRYFVRVSDGSGSYSLRLQAFRSTFEADTVGTKQILYIDFDGATVRTDIFGVPGTARLESLADSVARFGLTTADINPLIDKILAQVSEDFLGSLPSIGKNGYYSATGVPGQFDIDIRNSRDHADPWGLPNVSRVVVGGDALSSRIGGILGIAQSVDVGNFAHEETALVLPGEFAGFDLIPRAPLVSYIDVLAEAIGNTISHEAGHFFGGIHTEQDNLVFNIMDSGNTANTFSFFQSILGYGLDGIFGNADDIDVDFGTDRLEDLEFPLGSRVDNAAVMAFGLSTGTRGGVVTGRVFNDRNRDGLLGTGEEGLVGLQVFADYNLNGVLDSSEPRASSIADGTYILTVAPGTWQIRSTVQTSYIVTGSAVRTITVGTGQTVSGINFGQFLPNQSVSGFKWSDTNGNGLRDTGEPGIPGFWIYVDLDGDDRIDIGEPAAITGTDGSYSLSPPVSGTFAIREVVPPGYIQTFPASGEHVVTFNGITPLRGIDFGNLPARDFGDAPSPYPTLAANNGPSHGRATGLTLGTAFDFEGDGLPNATATGDDISGTTNTSGQVVDDEDGVAFPRPIVANDTQNSARIFVTNTTGSVAYLNGWIDFNRDGDWNDIGERIIADARVTTSGSANYTFSAPAGAALGNTYARFRLSNTPALGVTGPADTGEVEDYLVTIFDTENYAFDDSFTVARNSVANVFDVQANDYPTTVPGETSTITRVTQGTAGGTVVTNGTNVTYTPRSGFVGTETFTYTILTSSGRTDTATVTVRTIFQLNDPIAVDDSYDVAQNSVAVPLNVLANDLEGTTGSLTITNISTPNRGGLAVVGQGGLSIRYTPQAGFGGTETFTYTAVDSAGKTATATVTVHTIEGDRLDDTVEFALSFTDLVGNPISAVTQGQRFQVHITVDDLRTFPTEPGVYAAYLDLLYNASLVSTVPASAGSSFDFDVQFFSPYTSGQLGSGSTPGVISDLGAFAGFPSSFNQPNPIRLATLTFEARSTGIADFAGDPANSSPATDVVLWDTISSPVDLQQVRYRRASIEIVPSGVDFPFAVDDSPTSALVVNAGPTPINVLQNDRVGSNGPIRISAVSTPMSGTVFIDDRGTTSTSDDRVVYTPNTNFQGVDQFTYTIADQRGFISTAEVTVQVGNTSADDVIQFRLEVTNLSGTPIDQIGVGQTFQLRGYVQQLQAFNGGQLQGVYAAFQDILYNSSLVTIASLDYEDVFGNRGTESPVAGREYPFAPSGDVRIPGLINELGSISKETPTGIVFPGAEEKLQFIVEVTAAATGTVVFQGDPADVSPFHDSLVFDPTDVVPISRIRYMSDSITIGSSIVGGEAFTNMANRFDVNNDGATSPIDALIVINSLNRGGSRVLPRATGAEGESSNTMFVDVNADGYVSPIDVLQVINALNRRSSGEGESETASDASSFISDDLNGAIDLLADDIMNSRRRR